MLFLWASECWRSRACIRNFYLLTQMCKTLIYHIMDDGWYFESEQKREGESRNIKCEQSVLRKQRTRIAPCGNYRRFELAGWRWLSDCRRFTSCVHRNLMLQKVFFIGDSFKCKRLLTPVHLLTWYLDSPTLLNSNWVNILVRRRKQMLKYVNGQRKLCSARM